MSFETFQEKFDLKTNFLEYGLTIKLYMDNLELPASNLTRPENSLLNSILHKDTWVYQTYTKPFINKIPILHKTSVRNGMKIRSSSASS